MNRRKGVRRRGGTRRFSGAASREHVPVDQRSHHILKRQHLDRSIRQQLATSPCAGESHPPDRLVLWEPLTDGPTYIRELGRSHARAIEFALAPGAGPVDESLGAEAIGFTVSDELRQQLSMLNLNALVHVCAREVAILSRPEDASAQALVQALQAHGKAVKAGSLRHDLVWSSEEALGAALAPADVLLALQAQIMDSLQ